MNFSGLRLLFISVWYTHPSQLFYRIILHIKRFIYSNFASQNIITNTAYNHNSNIKIHKNLPCSIFPARDNLVIKKDGQVFLKFLNETRVLDKPVNWHPQEHQHGTRLWLLNLHYMEFLEGLDDSHYIEIVKDWISNVKPYNGKYWLYDWNSYALSIRVVVWMQQYEKRLIGIDLNDKEYLLSSLYAQVCFLSNNLELDIRGNHLIKNIKALLWASKFFNMPEAIEWNKLAIKLLKIEVSNQVTPDGMHYELSPAYHLQVFVDLLECYYLIDDNEYKYKLDSVLALMAQNLVDMIHPDGMVSLFNDGGLNWVAYSPEKCLEIYENLVGRKVSPNDKIVYSHAGYYGLRSDANLILFDCAALAPDHLPAHGHGDALSLEWSVDGERILIDPGVYEYNPGEYREFSRSTKAHNTVTLDNYDQSEFWKAFRVGRRARIVTRYHEETNKGLRVVAAHDGYSWLKGKPIHFREVDMQPNKIIIKDKIEGGHGQIAVSRFMLSPSVEVIRENEKYLITKGKIRIKLVCDLEVKIKDTICFLNFGCKQTTKQIILEIGSAPCESTLKFEVLN